MKPNKIFRIIILFYPFIACYPAFARFGGGGGHSHSSGGHSFGGHGYGGGGGGYSPSYIIFIIILYLLIKYINYKRQKEKGNLPINGNNENNQERENNQEQPRHGMPFPAGLDAAKVKVSFLALQDAWQQKNLTNVRKWLSDGMYQRLTCQFKMMNVLEQKNTLANIRVNNLSVTRIITDGHYQVADVPISFTMDDRFSSSKYPQFNENYTAESDTEYWTFIKRTDSINEKNLYDNKNCPNCGAPFEVKMGEISRCSHCKTLTNSAAYDWVLSEVTQAADYTGGAGQNDAKLMKLMQNDPFFAAQRMEDIASNIFMQVMEVLTVDDTKRLARFADEPTAGLIAQKKKLVKPFIFDRLYLNSVDLNRYSTDGNLVKLYFNLTATFRRVSTGDKLHMMDADFVSKPCYMELSRNKEVPPNPVSGETVYSYECSSCGAPFTDTTDDLCTYCYALVVDKEKNWVLTGFTFDI